MENIMHPTIDGLREEGIKYKGVLYAGLMIRDGKPSVLEFNCRLGDPETQPVFARLDSDFVDIAMAICDERLSGIKVEWKKDAAVCVVIASGGYPGKYEKGKVISGLDEANRVDDVFVFHAGTGFDDGQITTSGGRVLGVTATGRDIKAAKEQAYKAVGQIRFE